MGRGGNRFRATRPWRPPVPQAGQSGREDRIRRLRAYGRPESVRQIAHSRGQGENHGRSEATLGAAWEVGQRRINRSLVSRPAEDDEQSSLPKLRLKIEVGGEGERVRVPKMWLEDERGSEADSQNSEEAPSRALSLLA